MRGLTEYAGGVECEGRRRHEDRRGVCVLGEVGVRWEEGTTGNERSVKGV